MGVVTRGKLCLIAMVVAVASVAAGVLAAGASSGQGDRWSFAPEGPANLRLRDESADVHLWLSCILTHCRPSARAYVRAAGAGSFTALRVVRKSDGSDVVHVPASIANAPQGFEYYVAAHDAASHQQARYPIGGAAAPRRSFLLEHPVIVDLGSPRRLAAAPPHRRVVSVAWGSRPDQVGLVRTESRYAGVAGFDATSSGTVWLLDQVKRRVLGFRHGTETRVLPLAIGFEAADLALGPHGEFYVLDYGRYVLHEFTATGRTVASFDVPDELATEVRALGSTVYVDLQPSGQWAPVIRNGTVLDRLAVIRGVLAGAPLADGRQVAVWARDDVRVALLGGGSVERSWRLVGAAAKGAVLDLAQPLGKRLVVVLAQSNRYQVVVLEGHRVVERFGVPLQEWTDSAAGTFRLVGSSLYHLGSTSRGAFVDRYDLTR